MPAAVPSSNIEQAVCKAPDGTFDAGQQLSLPAVGLSNVHRWVLVGHCLSSVGLHRVFKYSVHPNPLDLTIDS